MKKVSIIIRTKNEERWITPCLAGVFAQDYRDFEVILVDNESTDMTVEKAKQFNIVKVISCEKYLPGLALNMGIRESKGEYIVCLSGHCIPVNEKWLSNLLRNFDDKEVAGVYGRQEPLAFTPDSDKRDLSIIFGLDRRVQKKDSFFHNANSMIKKALWDEVPFDETITNIEDRVWAEKMLRNGNKIVYEPSASVYHYHGIHQNWDVERCANIVRILEDLKDDRIEDMLHVNLEKLNVVAIIPVKGEIEYVRDRPLISYTIEIALKSKYINSAIVSTDNPELARLAENLGASAPFLRDESLSKDFVDIEKVLQYSLEKIEGLEIYPDLVVYLEVTFPFRPAQLIDSMIVEQVKNGFDSVLAAKRESSSIWTEENGRIKRVDGGDIPRKYKEPTFIGAKGLCCVTHPEFIREGLLLGTRIGIFELNNHYSSIEVREQQDLRFAERFIDIWEEEQSR